MRPWDVEGITTVDPPIIIPGDGGGDPTIVLTTALEANSAQREEGPLRVLIVEDDAADADAMLNELCRDGRRVAWRLVETEEEFRSALVWDPDVILSDLHLARFSGLEALNLLEESGSDVPLIIVSSTIGEDNAVAALKGGASDYLLKDRLWRLGKSVEQALEQNRLRHEAQASAQEAARTLELLRDVNEQRRRLLARLVTAQEEEAKRIAADIHDDSVQAVATVGLMLGMLAKDLTPTQQDKVRQLETAVEVAVSRLRTLIFNLRPPALDREGLGAAFEEYLERMHEDSGIAYRLGNHLTFQPPLEVRVILYRIGQEALFNVRKHSQATQLSVSLEHDDDGFLLTVEDDGSGFSADECAASPLGHLGLVAMRERAELAGGWTRIESRPGEGTKVQAWIPECPATRRR